MAKRHLTRREFLAKTSTNLAVASAVPLGVAMAANVGVPALAGGSPVRTKPFPTWPATDELDEAHILKALRNHRWCTYDGEFIPQFENAWAEKLGARGAVMTPCGTHALHTALEVLDIGPGDEVLVSPYTYIATIDAILMTYALPVFVDSDPATFQMDPEDIERRITTHTRAILPVHIYGTPASLDRILAIAAKHNLPVIEDACQSHLAEWRGKRLGTLGTVGCFSFQETKILPGGEAGALVSNHPDLIDRAFVFRDFGRDPKQSNRHVVRGTKYRISDFAAAVLMAQMTRFEEVCARREKNAAYLKEEIRKVPGIMPQQHYPESTRQTYYRFGLRYNKEQFHGLERGKLCRALAAEGIPAEEGYSALNRDPFIENTLNSRGYRTIYSRERLDRYRAHNQCPKNDELCATALALPHEVLLGTRQDVDDVVTAFAKVQKNSADL